MLNTAPRLYAGAANTLALIAALAAASASMILKPLRWVGSVGYVLWASLGWLFLPVFLSRNTALPSWVAAIAGFWLWGMVLVLTFAVRHLRRS